LITNIDDGFNFLGFNVRKYKGKLMIKPSKKSVAALMDKVRDTIKSLWGALPEVLIGKLNPIIRGWVNYHKHVAAKKIFSKVDWQIDKLLKNWAKRRHPDKRIGWIMRKYFSSAAVKSVFSIRVKTATGEHKVYALMKASLPPILRHIKVRQQANPFDPAYKAYFKQRRRGHAVTALDRQKTLRLRAA
jgi:RNA-directed DNA polymerase